MKKQSFMCVLLIVLMPFSLLAQSPLLMMKEKAKMGMGQSQALQIPKQTPSSSELEKLGGAEKPNLPSRIETIFNQFLSKSETPLNIASTKEKVELTQFGYDVFDTIGTNVSENIPANADYRLGPGDEFTLTLWGLVEGIYNLRVNKEGNVTLPKAGVVPIAGVRFGDLESILREQFAKYYKDFNISVAMGELRGIQVYVIGDVQKPGQYHLSSVATLFHALAAAWGPTKQGSLRKIELRRPGQETTFVDLYNFLVTGEPIPEIPMDEGTTIFVPIIGPTVAIAGNVYRPAIYEIREKETLETGINLAGGFLPTGSLYRILMERVESHEKRTLLDVELSPTLPDRNKEKMQISLSNMDIIKVLPIYPEIWQKVTLLGHIKHPGEYEWKPGLRLSDILTQEQILPTTYMEKIEVVRLDPSTLEKKLVTVNPRHVLQGIAEEDIVLQQKDTIYVFSEDKGPYKVTVKGEIKLPGEYMIQKGERLSSVLLRSGGFTEEAYPQGTRFMRKSVSEDQNRSLQDSIHRLELEILRRQSQERAPLSQEGASIEVSESAVTEKLLTTLKAQKGEGRIIISVTDNLEALQNSRDDILLQDGDSIEVPLRPGTVLVMGSVYNPSAITWTNGLRVKDYLKEVGGVVPNANRKEMYLLKASGRVVHKGYASLLREKLEPGDVISVPEKTKKPGRGLITLKDITQIFFQLGTSSALLFAAVK